MSITIKINNETKDRLDKLRERLLLKGIKLKQNELIDYIITVAELDPILFEKEMDKELKKFSDEEWNNKIKELITDHNENLEKLAE